jgi:hypothetical protein
MKLLNKWYYAAIIGGIAMIAWGIYRGKTYYMWIGGLMLGAVMLWWSIKKIFGKKPEPK